MNSAGSFPGNLRLYSVNIPAHEGKSYLDLAMGSKVKRPNHLSSGVE